MKHQRKLNLAGKLTALAAILVAGFLFGFALTTARADGPKPGAPTPIPSTQYFSSTTIQLADGLSLNRYNIHGPSHPPAGSASERAAVNPPTSARTLVVPAFDWVYGCSAVSASMIAGYYDQNGYPNMYTGPTNGGVMPMDNSVWGTWSDGTDTYPNNPLTATHNGVDGLATNGSLDDYWVAYNSTANDPFVTGGWLQHTWGTAIGDYMKTSQFAYGNSDGSTSFYNYTNSAQKLTCSAMLSYKINTLDGTYGRKLFYQARGYTVTDCYSQNTDNTVSGGFSFAQLKAQIDAGQPVLLNLAGHSIVAVGYDDTGKTVYVHDTWDYQTHSMTWGGSYAGMQLLSVSIVNLAKSVTKSLPSVPSQDGWVLETTTTSNTGGRMNRVAANLLLGDNAAKRQYRSVLSFATGAAIPDKAVITNISLRVKQAAITGYSDPITLFNGIKVDVKNGFLGAGSLLELGDFQSAATKSYGPFMPVPAVDGWYDINLTGAKASINKLTTGLGLTQIRLRFVLDDNNDAVADTLALYSGNAPLTTDRPRLVITYYIP